MRIAYRRATLDEASVSPSPVAQFKRWFDDAVNSGIVEPNAMLLATAHPTRGPSARCVLLKSLRRGEFVFFTNYTSRKAQDIAAQKRVALTFYWAELERQVRIEGLAHKVSRAESQRYFRKRPRDSQLGALVSPQSTVIHDRAALESTLQKVAVSLRGSPVPCPLHWGGYAVRPLRVEFWQGRPGRLHDRIEYRRRKGGWRIVRLAP
ncbi:MAG: pyridoxamine 5'-phosphate oxidase [Bdellovibrionota bacterium]|nr:MAG: pyridoxamine 5'-phosphate oxidase [Bdellovibrionota bacterium]